MQRLAVCRVRSDLGDPLTLWLEKLCVSVSLWLTRERDRSVILKMRKT